MKLLISLFLFYMYTDLVTGYGDASSGCLVTAEEGSPKSFVYSRDASQDDGFYKWEMTIGESRVVVATTLPNVFPNGASPRSDNFQAYTGESTKPGWQDLYLYVASVNRSMTYIQCSGLDYDTFYYDFSRNHTYGYCSLVIFVRPTTPMCEAPRFDMTERVMELSCNTYVHPHGICNFTYQGSGHGLGQNYKVEYSHEQSHTTGLFNTQCSLKVPISDVTWNTNVTFTVSAAPDITDYKNYTVNRTWTFPLSIVKPTKPVCEEPKVRGFEPFLEVTCESAALHWSVCEFTFMSIIGNGSFDVTYEQDRTQSDALTTITKTKCTVKVPLDSVPWDEQFAAQVKVAPDVADKSDLWVSGDWTAAYYKERPRIVSFQANKNNVTSIHFAVDDNITFTCIATGSPAVKLYLVKDGGEVLHVSGVPNRLDYVIRGADCSHSAEYGCHIKNEKAGSSNLTIAVVLEENEFQNLTPICDPPVISDMTPYFRVTCRSLDLQETTCHARFQYTNGTTFPTASRIRYYNKYMSGKSYLTCDLDTDISEFFPGFNYEMVVEFSKVIKRCNVNRRHEISKIFSFDKPLLTRFTANNQAGTVDFKEGDDLRFTCTAIGTPKPRMRLVDDYGVTIYQSDVPGTLDYTVSNLYCGQSNVYTCVADNGFNSSDKISSYGRCYQTSLNMSAIKISVSVIGSALAIGILCITGCCCKRRFPGASRQSQNVPTNESLGGLPHLQADTRARHHQEHTRPAEYPNYVHQSTRNGAQSLANASRPESQTHSGQLSNGTENPRRAIFLIFRWFSPNPYTSLTNNSLNPLNEQQPGSVMSPPPYDLPSSPPPEYMEIPTHSRNPVLNDDHPPVYTVGDSVDV